MLRFNNDKDCVINQGQLDKYSHHILRALDIATCYELDQDYIVVASGFSKTPSYNGYINILYANGYSILLEHCSKPYNVGDVVIKGTIVIGVATQKHIHLEVMTGKYSRCKKITPSNFIINASGTNGYNYRLSGFDGIDVVDAFTFNGKLISRFNATLPNFKKSLIAIEKESGVKYMQFIRKARKMRFKRDLEVYTQANLSNKAHSDRKVKKGDVKLVIEFTPDKNGVIWYYIDKVGFVKAYDPTSKKWNCKAL